MVQDKQLPLSNETTVRRKLWWLLKILVTGLIISYIISTLQQEQKGFQAIGTVLAGVFVAQNGTLLLLMLLMVPLNWALESLKWQRLAQKVVPITFGEAFRSTLTGLAVGVAVPAQLGDTLGRVASLKSGNRLLTIGAALVSNGIQFYVSLAVGLVSWLLVGSTVSVSSTIRGTITGGLLFLVMLGPVVACYRASLTQWNSTNSFLKKISPYFQVISQYETRDLLTALLYGMLRYGVFMVQFVLALSLFDFRLSLLELSACVGLILLAKTLIPAVNLFGDLGLREFTALYLFSHYGLPSEQVISATLLVWAINILGPLLVGIVLVWQHKWLSRDD
ncbi:lysylphosphatidylglycerol synthase domain-containing protein [Telluribacter sp.]|jgi:uncharacterized membrane protein YbhN (UPF0104 family)|uniref:lysylphosphatidylglycerol synthase domain-containing protein n=1 Tax=Telluribacter sp. TaxID=1978767 RepID=UPI002E0F1FE7|nr:lysylphosphatidylglycerol synthase domain-containing protein [Telluribacter sp.]